MENFNKLLVEANTETARIKRHAKETQGFSGRDNFDYSFSDMVTFQEQGETGSKICVLNPQAFSVYLSQNKGNSKAMKRLFNDIMEMNKILAGVKSEQNLSDDESE